MTQPVEAPAEASAQEPAAAAGAAAEQPVRLPYRLLTGTDDRAFCEKVSAALRDGYRLHGAPAVTFDGQRIVTAQAVVLDETGDTR